MEFIYVFREKDRDAMLAAGYQMLKQNQEGTMFVFLPKENMTFERNDIPHVCSSVLTF